jgi:hypothetical protein
MHLDHIVIIVPNLDHIIDHVRTLLDCVPIYGGKHRLYGTHNALLGLRSDSGYKQYIEFLAIDPRSGSRSHYPLMRIKSSSLD